MAYRIIFFSTIAAVESILSLPKTDVRQLPVIEILTVSRKARIVGPSLQPPADINSRRIVTLFGQSIGGQVGQFIGNQLQLDIGDTVIGIDIEYGQITVK